MSGNKHFDKIAWTVTALMLVVTVLFMNGATLGIEVMAHTMGYENRLFDNTRVHTIDIVMNDWEEFLSNATSEEYYAAHVVIDGEAYKNVGIRGKGNTSLSTVSSMDSERYSFKIEFDQYDNSITYHGLDKLCLNNLIQDTTMMKDYLTYMMMNAFGVNAPLCSFVYITVNSEDWGLYLAVEGVEEAFLERNYGSAYGKLYKPDSMSFGSGRGGFGGMGSSDVKLQYIDDSTESYSNIWNGAKTDIDEADQSRLIESLKKLSNGEKIETVVDIEQVIRYFVVHNYVCNGDSYTGSMIHNYYLYEEDGQMAMIPWDYNLAFGTFRGNNAQSTINTPIDSPIDGGSSDDRPMWSWIIENEEYTDLYHQYFTEFLNTVDIAGIIDNAYTLIRSYVENDPTKFCTYAEFETGVEALRQFCTLRTESITAQLTNGETTETMHYVDASALTLSDMGSMSMGGGFGDKTKGMPQSGETPEIPKDFDPSKMSGQTAPKQDVQTSGEPSESADVSKPDTSGEMVRPSRDNMQMPGDDFDFTMHDTGASAPDSSGWLLIAASALILCVGLVLAKIYRY